MDKKIRAIGAALLAAVWVVLVGFAWFSPAKEMSEAERRPLAQMPEVTMKSILGWDCSGWVPATPLSAMWCRWHLPGLPSPAGDCPALCQAFCFPPWWAGG